MITVILALALVGFILWLVLTYVPMPDPIKKLIIAVAVVFIILYLLSVLGYVDIPIRTLHRP